MPGGYITGGYFNIYASLAGIGYPMPSCNPWGLPTEDNQEVGLGWGNNFDVVGKDTAHHSYLYFTKSANSPGALKVLGGRQLFWDQGSNQFNEDNVWGARSNIEVWVYESTAYFNTIADWTTPSFITFYLAPATSAVPGLKMVGGQQSTSDLTAQRPFIPYMGWGDVGGQPQFIGTGKAWSEVYQEWGFSKLSAFFQPG